MTVDDIEAELLQRGSVARDVEPLGKAFLDLSPIDFGTLFTGAATATSIAAAGLLVGVIVGDLSQDGESLHL